MKKLLFLGVGSALMFTMGGVGPASADNGPHVSTAVAAGQTSLITNAGGGRCASCHRAHTAKAEFLLKDSQPALCYTCHGGSGATTNVKDGVNAYTNAALRGGGFQNAKIDGAGAEKTMDTTPGAHGIPVLSEKVPVLGNGAAVTSKHQIDGTTTGTIWGNGAISATVNPGKAGVTLECGSCHDPHGNGNYRILKPVPNDSGATVPVIIPDAVGKNYTTANYWLVTDRQVPLVSGSTTLPVAGQTDGYITNVAAWCTTCHTRYLAGSGSYLTPLKDATTGAVDAVFTYRHRSDRTDKDGVSRPNCIQCHVSHGSNVSMSGDAAAASLPGGATLASTDAGYGDSRLLRVNNRGTCVMCHNV